MIPERFQVLGEIGEGGMGTVLRVFDRELGQELALKTLREEDATRLLALKREFRARVSLSHPNLVRLHELHVDGHGGWFTMEVVEGEDLLSWVLWADRPPAADSDAPTPPQGEAPAQVSATWSSGTWNVSEDDTLGTRGDEPFGSDDLLAPTPPALQPVALHEAGVVRLRRAFAQLVRALQALHQAGWVHRDVKPSNILVTAEGRVVLLDFGLAVRTDGPGADPPDASGTAAWMAPEQVAREPVGPAADLYAVGVMLYEALTRCDPIPARSLSEKLMLKRTWTPIHPCTLVDGLPQELGDLAMALLAVDPAARPDAEATLAALGEGPNPRFTQVSGLREALVGRREEVAQLERALDRARDGEVSLVHVHGPSGAGKTHLVHHVLAGADDAVVLIGRCHPEVRTPYKAFDDAIDHLARRLRGLPKHQQRALRPPGLRGLTQVFAALRSVPGLATDTSAEGVPSSPDLRREAFAALTALLRAVSKDRPLVVWLDDVHWGDRDSADLAREVLTVPGLMLVLTWRSEARARSVFLSALEETLTAPADLGLRGARPSVLELGLQPLDAPGVAELLRDQLQLEDIPPPLARDVLAQSGGNPFMVATIARHLRAGAATAELQGLDLRALIRRHLALLEPEDMRLMEAAAVATRPTPSAAVLEAAEQPKAARGRMVDLSNARLLRLVSEGEAVAVAPYHDQIRQAVVQALDADARRALHSRLAQALERHVPGDADSLALHWEAAGEPLRAGAYARAAGERAYQAMAFERAAELSDKALQLLGPEADRPALLSLRAEALAAQGLSLEAADTFSAAAAAAREAGHAPLELQRLQVEGAKHLLNAGYYARGWREMSAALQASGADLPKSLRRARLDSTLRRVRYLLFGLPRARPGSSPSPEARLRIEALWSTALAFAGVSALLSDLFRLRCIDEAARHGATFNLLSAYAFEACMLAFLDGRLMARRQRECVALVTRGLPEFDPDGGALRLELVRVAEAAGKGDLRAQLMHAEQALRLIQEGPNRLVPDRGALLHFITALTCQYQFDGLAATGRLRELGQAMEARLADFEARADRRGLKCCYEGDAALLWLAWDQPERAWRTRNLAHPQGQRALGWPASHFAEPKEYRRAGGWVNAALYEGDPDGAAVVLDEALGPLEGTLIQRMRSPRVYSRELRARVRLAQALARPPSERARLLAQARRDWRALAADHVPLATPYAASVEATLRLAEGRDAEPALRRAIEVLDAHGYALRREAARWTLGHLRGQAGVALRDQAEAAMRAEGVVYPARLARVLMPRPD